MPKHPDQERLLGILDGLDDPVLGPRHLAEPVADPAEALVVVRLDRSVYLCEPRGRINPHRMLGPLPDHRTVLLVPEDVGQVLDDLAAAHDVQPPDAATDPADG